MKYSINNKFNYLCPVMLILFLMTGAGKLMAMEQIFADGFESGDTSLWDRNIGTPPVAITSDNVHMGSYAAEIEGVDAALVKRVTAIRDGTVSLYCWIAISTEKMEGIKSCAMGARLSQRAKGELMIGVKDDQVFADMWSDNEQFLMPIEDVFSFICNSVLPCDRWHRFSIKYDFYTQTAVFAVNDIIILRQQVNLPQISYLGVGRLPLPGQNGADDMPSATDIFYIDTVGLLHYPRRRPKIPRF